MFVMYLQLHFLILYRYSINQCIKIIYIWPFSANTISSVATWKNMTEKFQSNSSTSTTEPISHYFGLALCFLVTRQRFVSSTIQQKNCVFLKKHLVVSTMQCCLIQSCPSFFHKKKFRGDIYLVQIQQMSIKTYQFSKILSMLKSHLEFFLFLQVDLERKRRCGISRENILNNIYCPAAGDSRKSENEPGFNSLPHPSEDRLASASAVCIGE